MSEILNEMHDPAYWAYPEQYPALAEGILSENIDSYRNEIIERYHSLFGNPDSTERSVAIANSFPDVQGLLVITQDSRWQGSKEQLLEVANTHYDKDVGWAGSRGNFEDLARQTFALLDYHGPGARILLEDDVILSRQRLFCVPHLDRDSHYIALPSYGVQAYGGEPEEAFTAEGRYIGSRLRMAMAASMFVLPRLVVGETYRHHVEAPGLSRLTKIVHTSAIGPPINPPSALPLPHQRRV